MRALAAAAFLLVLAGCGSDLVAEGEPVGDPYAGPLHVPVLEPDHPDPLVRSGAAGAALECAGDPLLGSTGSNWGVSTGHDTAAEALAAFVESDIPPLPVRGYRVERDEEDRVLFSFDADGATKVAVIVADGAGGEAGWGVETFAQCDPAELPSPVTDDMGLEVWADRQGERVPTTVVRSSAGPEHCEWDSATFLQVEKDTFVKDPEGALPAEWFDLGFDGDATLPEDAVDTGYRLDDTSLWVAPDRSAAYLVTGGQVERWPLAHDRWLCR